MSIRSRLFLLILAAIIPAFALITWHAVNERAAALRAAENDALNLVRIARKLEDGAVSTIHQILDSLSKMPEIHSMRASPDCDRLLANLQALHPIYSNLAVADLDGDIFCSALPLDAPVNIRDREYFRGAIETGEFSAGRFQLGRITNVTTINFGYPLRDTHGVINGVVFAAMNLDAFSGLIHGLELPDDTTLALIDEDGTLLAHSDPETDRIGTRWPGQLHDTGTDAVSVMPGLDGEDRLYAIGPLLQTAGGNVYVAAGIPKDAIVLAANADLRNSLAIMFFILLLVLLITWHGTDVVLHRRIKRLLSAQHELAHGHAEARSGAETSDDEIGELTRSFDQMAETLEHTHRAMQTLSAVNRALIRSESELELLQRMCELAVRVGNFSFAWIGYICNDEHQSIEPVALAGYPGGMNAFRKTVHDISWGEHGRNDSLMSRAIRSGTEQVVQDISLDESSKTLRSLAHMKQSVAAAAIPLIVDGQIIGALSVHSDTRDVFGETHIRLLQETVTDLCFGISVLRAREEHRLIQEKADRIAFYDSLTGLPNLSRFMQEITSWLANENTRFGIVVINVDRFSEINEAFGFEQGDRLLEIFSRRLSRVVSSNEFVARMRGDDFGVLFPILDENQLAYTMDRLLSVLGNTFELAGVPIDIDATAGVTIAVPGDSSVDGLLRQVDVAMRRGKQAGARWVLYSPELDRAHPQRLALAAELRRAIDSFQLLLHYQPKIDMVGKKLMGVEALVRWQHPDRGMIPPAEFIPLAEHTGLIKPLTEFVMEAAAAQARLWRDAGMPLAIAVNVSSRNLQDPQFYDFARQLIHRFDISPGLLEIELTESAVMEDMEAASKLLHALNKLGIQLSIDDYGTGYSSLRYLQQLAVNNLKIDQSFVGRLLVDRDSAAIVASTISMGHDLGLMVVAEGVETLEIYQQLAELGCDIAQGYFFSKPLPEEQITPWIKRFDINNWIAPAGSQD